jgi:excisionase family DNA binding protein
VNRQELLTTREAAQHAQIGVAQLRRWVRSGKLPCYRDQGNRILVDRDELDAFVRPRRQVRS